MEILFVLFLWLMGLFVAKPGDFQVPPGRLSAEEKVVLVILLIVGSIAVGEVIVAWLR